LIEKPLMLSFRRSAAASSRLDEARVLRLALLITDPGGEILYWNREAEKAFEALPPDRSVRKLDELFSPETIEELRDRRGWTRVSPMGAPGTSWKMRARDPISSGRSLFLFYAEPQPR
jgi:PAS domain-containing protein